MVAGVIKGVVDLNEVKIVVGSLAFIGLHIF
jgi:hypothetical protein